MRTDFTNLGINEVLTNMTFVETFLALNAGCVIARPLMVGYRSSSEHCPPPNYFVKKVVMDDWDESVYFSIVIKDYQFDKVWEPNYTDMYANDFIIANNETELESYFEMKEFLYQLKKA